MAGILVVSIALWLIKPVKCSSIIPTIVKYTHLNTGKVITILVLPHIDISYWEWGGFVK